MLTIVSGCEENRKEREKTFFVLAKREKNGDGGGDGVIRIEKEGDLIQRIEFQSNKGHNTSDYC